MRTQDVCGVCGDLSRSVRNNRARKTVTDPEVETKVETALFSVERSRGRVTDPRCTVAGAGPEKRVTDPGRPKSGYRYGRTQARETVTDPGPEHLQLNNNNPISIGLQGDH